MQPDASALLWDAREAARLILLFIEGRGRQHYHDDPMLRSAVERQFQIIGEALNRLSRVDATTAALIPELPRIVAFRNVLVHGYAVIDDELVWQVASTRVPALVETMDRLLAQGGTRESEPGS
jgi:uncharacterized protein with HEPN domain